MKNLLILLLVISFNFVTKSFADLGDKVKFSLANINYVNFYNEDDFKNNNITIFAFIDNKCMPCLAEMVFLKDNKKYYKNIEFVLIGTSYHKDTKEFIKKAGVSEGDFTILNVSDRNNPRDLLKRFGNKEGILPYSIAMNKNQKLCHKLVGALNSQKIQNIISKCK